MSDITHKKIAIGILIVALVLIIILHFCLHESFTTKREKATAITDWFKDTRSPTYVKYKKALDGKSNIVEYTDVMKLFRERNLTVSEVEKVI